MLPLAIGAVVVGVPTTAHTPLSGHFSPVRAVVPNGTFSAVLIAASFTRMDGRAQFESSL